MIGEVGNIIMGSAATALFTIIGKEVQITTPDVRTSRLSEVRKSFKEERLVTILEFHQGLSGSNILVMDKKTALIIADLMMGGTGQDVKGELDELKSSAVGEAMNQMMGTASTAMAGFLKKPIAITPPNVGISDFSRKEVQFPEISTDGDTDAAVVSFRMEIEDLATTELYQIVPISFVKRLYALFTEGKRLLRLPRRRQNPRPSNLRFRQPQGKKPRRIWGIFHRHRRNTNRSPYRRRSSRTFLQKASCICLNSWNCCTTSRSK